MKANNNSFKVLNLVEEESDISSRNVPPSLRKESKTYLVLLDDGFLSLEDAAIDGPHN